MDLVAKCGCVKTVPMRDRQLHRCPDHDEVFMHPSALKPRKPLRRVSEKREGEVRRTGSTLKRGRGFAVARPQAEKVRDLPCVVSGQDRYEATIHPAHLWDRGRGGCDDALCVFPLRADLHRLYDEHKLDVLPYLLTRGYYAELAHVIEAHRVSPTSLLERVTGERWAPVEQGVTA